MSHLKVRNLLETRLADWSAERTYSLPIAWQNTPLNLPQATYLRAFVLPADTGSDDLEGVHRSYIGIFQITIVISDGLGAGVAEAIADELAALFPNNLRLTLNGFTVQIIRPLAIGIAQQEPESYALPVSLSYRADTVG